ncbi:SCY1-like protein 2 [Cercospora beticola]|uniref:SCY1-like protein 2 n=1 Tax=Cercospora beticola TaxID=122368 RepID=A0A2G5I8P9_CERBT|nr:SCY1-like protein 2 [Cercospora beticola]PIB01236.1 SCY1-like protein 2 [Cercospora beticola]WPA96912.1 hypothetical protein RHO25_001520 [Cercospora beticola]CAK1354710.1 unnamed protein product [Cercospora beticola]
MFANALKSFSSNIASNYSIAPQPSASAGVWKIYDAKSKRTGKAASIFVFDRKSLEAPGGNSALGGRSGGVSLKRAHEEVLESLKKEASSLARLRHPSILELAEPVEETSRGGLQFVSEPVVSSLAGLLEEKEQSSSRSSGRVSRYVVDESDGSGRRKEFEIDELEIQKGLLQLAKGLEFLHESAGLVHANLTPAAVIVNAKGDWKISGLAFCSPHESSQSASAVQPISLHEVLNHDPRLPRSVQLNIDYTSPDFVLDNSLTSSADMFSLGLLIIALYNNPHSSPISTGSSLSAYKRIFSSSSSVPSQHNNFLVPASHPLPPKLASELLPRLITRRPAQRLTAKAFQEASYFQNVLVDTIRFLDALPGKTQNEKVAFMRGLPKIMPQFPKNVLEKKVLPALLEEMKDRDLLALILSNLLAMTKEMPNGKRAFTDQVVPKLREVFLTSKPAERDTSKEGALIVLLEAMETITENCAGKEFRDDILPIILLALDSPTHGLIDAALSTLPFVLPCLDFSTVKNELFPVIAQVFAKTSSLHIKIRGLEAFSTLCGSSEQDDGDNDGLNGIGFADSKSNSKTNSVILDKYTIQEKMVPMLRGIKTKEPGVMMAALKVMRHIGGVVDIEFLAKSVLPILWDWSLGPLLNLEQFAAFMKLIKTLSNRIEAEQTKKLQELSSSGGHANGGVPSARGSTRTLAASNGQSNGDHTDFEQLVSGRTQPGNGNDLMNDWSASVPARPQRNASQTSTPTFSWQTSSSNPATQTSMSSLRPAQIPGRTVTPDLAAFSSLVPSSQYSQPLQPQSASSSNMSSPAPTSKPNYGGSVDWSTAASRSTPTWSTQTPSLPNHSTSGTRQPSTFSLPPPPTSPQAVQPHYGMPSMSLAQKLQQQPQQQKPQNNQPSGLDKYESLI